jgi:CheY-like chemotaxis protein
MILVIEDHAALGEGIRMMLEAEGHDVTLVGSGEDALAYLAGNRPRLVIVDVSLPGISGLDVLRHVRADPNLRGVPVIVDTASPLPQVEAEVARAGATLIGKHSDAFLNLPAIVADHLAAPSA